MFTCGVQKFAHKNPVDQDDRHSARGNPRSLAALIKVSYFTAHCVPFSHQMTVKKALSNFRRTHYDNWQDHKQKFTDDQLVVLTDLLVSPNYYA